MKLQILVSAVDKDGRKLAERMKLPAEAILVIQGKENKYDQWERPEGRVRCYCFAERGVGLSRNNALLRADGDLCLFSDEDIVYRPDAAGTVLRAFEEHPGADMLLFNVKVHPDRRTYWTQRFHRVRWYNSGRYPAYSFAVRTDRMHAKNLSYSLLFGGGAKYANGEDSLFLLDCLRAGLKVFAVPEEIGEEVPRPSTWFKGYDEKFFHDRGVLYHVLYGPLAGLMGLRFLLKGRGKMWGEGAMDFGQAGKLLFSGIRDGRKEF